MAWYAYILRCSDNSLYCGTTIDLEHRLEAHNAGIGARYTRSRLACAVGVGPAGNEQISSIQRGLLVSGQSEGEPECSNPIGGIVMTKAELVRNWPRTQSYQKGGDSNAGHPGKNLADRSQGR